MMVRPFWPRVSPNFLACRVAVREFCSARDLGCVAVGLSGGADSLALTAALVAEGIEVTALCVDHGLQEGSAAQAERAAEQARSLGAGARVLRVEVDARAGESLEAAARRARYRAFACFLSGADSGPDNGVLREVAVAHTAEDQAETLLLSALRGQVTGMLPVTEVEGTRVLRPLLEVRRAQTLGACAELGLKPWQDPHNADPGFRRVALRQEILPRLGEILGGDAVPALAQAAADAAQDNAFLTTAACDDCAELAAMPEPRRRRALAAWLREHGVEVSRESIRGVEKLCVDWHGQGPVAVAGPRGLGQRLEVCRVGGKLALLPGH
ncbi:tRNA lysidine(34) synthetase TilS [Corynebacterium sp.]|uniref:tRNA lysidine(34) synthetase TilS n=1 Tax=Corynebacterium sp. TaxID=1720 RepID=UPI0026DB3840|nr:tRNA lysidine(34) synthetase TilS [Corynebacterium sp.]MDO5032267.1 tRNA lysidine(34) synthetase TilS [Corynebacterium sp.]